MRQNRRCRNRFVSDIEETRKMRADELFADPQGEAPEFFLSVMECMKR